MKHYLWCVFGLLVGCATALDSTPREIRVGAVARSIKWQTNARTASAPKFERGEMLPAPMLDRIPLPAGYVFVPVCCSAIPWFENIPIVGDDGKPEGTLHADGITRVLLPFPEGPADERIVYGHLDQAIVGGFGDERTDPTQPWRMFSFYLFGVVDHSEKRRALEDAKTLEEILRLSDLIVEVHTDDPQKG